MAGVSRRAGAVLRAGAASRLFAEPPRAAWVSRLSNGDAGVSTSGWTGALSRLSASKSTAAVTSTPSLTRREDRMTASSPSRSRMARIAWRMSRATCRTIFIYDSTADSAPHCADEPDLSIVGNFIPCQDVQARDGRADEAGERRAQLRGDEQDGGLARGLLAARGVGDAVLQPLRQTGLEAGIGGIARERALQHALELRLER